MAIEITETERKYEAPREAALPDLAGLPDVAGESDPEEQTLRAQYGELESLGGELKQLGDVLGTARDAEVLNAHLRGALEEMPPELVTGPPGFGKPARRFAKLVRKVQSALGEYHDGHRSPRSAPPYDRVEVRLLARIPVGRRLADSGTPLMREIIPDYAQRPAGIS